MSITLNSVPNEPSLSDLLDLLKKEIKLEMNCHHVGTVQSFNQAKMTVIATVNYTKTYFELNTKTGIYAPVQVNYSILVDCPIVVMGGGSSNLTFPIASGDECLLLFNDRDIDSWFSSGQVGPVSSNRLHSFSDAFALIGVKSMKNIIQSYDLTRAVLRNGAAGVGVSQSKVKIYNGSTTLNTTMQSILTQLENLCTAISALTVTCASPGNPSSVPINVASFTTINSQLSTLATQLGGLIE